MGDVIELERASSVGALQYRQSVREAPFASSSFGTPGSWQSSIRRRLKVILDLPIGWDGYDAAQLSRGTAIFAEQILESVWRPNLPLPEISPMSNGALMVEWIMGQKSLTIEIERPNGILSIYEDEDGDVEEISVTSNVAPIKAQLEKLLGLNEAIMAAG